MAKFKGFTTNTGRLALVNVKKITILSDSKEEGFTDIHFSTKDRDYITVQGRLWDNYKIICNKV
jgi:hypothetical protein